MKTTFKIILCCLSVFWIIISCSKDDLDIFVVNDFTTTIDENPNQDQLIGIIPYQVNKGLTEFIITSQNVPNAISINNSYGFSNASIYVQDPVHFDFETNPIIIATIKVNRVIVHLDFSQDILDTKIITVSINLKDLPE
ncbi:hypothetical protein [Confluentibacter flavum]|uniref:DUF1735 domain-containing protein n=1 Tax=Confluentibacter flavum TaxID=1909700 RepID=A0A2N3HG05_9FLAO|nr:hypothetical protein [Confluentibacter flavum]PKQ43917.1 hypothetical protein CSW08_15975 [Confluentibacter flavum]